MVGRFGHCHREATDAMPSFPYPRRSDRESIAADARHVIGMDPAAKAAVFIDLDRTMEAILAALPEAERRRRRDAARHLDPLPVPWWRNLRRSAWPHEHGTPHDAG
jgi:hypothetical protein